MNRYLEPDNLLVSVSDPPNPIQFIDNSWPNALVISWMSINMNYHHDDAHGRQYRNTLFEFHFVY